MRRFSILILIICVVTAVSYPSVAGNTPAIDYSSYEKDASPIPVVQNTFHDSHGNIVFCPDNRHFLNASEGCTVTMWSTSGSRIRDYTGLTNYPEAVAISGDGKTIAAESPRDKRVMIWDAGGKQIASQIYPTWILHPVLSHDGKLLITSGYQWMSLSRVDTDAHAIVPVFTLKDTTLNCVTFSPDGKYILGGDYYRPEIHIWDLSGKQTRLLSDAQRPSDIPRGISFSPDGKLIYVAALNSIHVWGWDGSLIRVIPREKTLHDILHGDIFFTADIPGGSIAANMNNSIQIWNPEGNVLTQEKAYETAISPDRKTFICQTVEGYELRSLDGRVIKRLPVTQDSVESASSSADGKFLATAFWSGRIDLWNTAEGTCVRIPAPDLVKCVAVSPDGTFAACAVYDGTVRIFDTTKPVLKLAGKHPGKGVTCVAVSADSRFIASGASDNTVKLWDRKGKPVRSFLGDTISELINCVALSPDGGLIAAGTTDGNVKLIETKTKRITVLKDGKLPVRGVSFSPDGKLIASGYEDGIIRLWSISGSLVRSIPGHTGIVNSVAFSPDGGLIVSGSENAGVRINTIDGDYTGGIPSSSGEIMSVNFIGRGKIFFGTKDSSAWIFDSASRKTVRLLTNVHGKWFVIHDNGRIDCSPDAGDDVLFIKGLTQYRAEQFMNEYRMPGMLKRFLGGETIPEPGK